MRFNNVEKRRSEYLVSKLTLVKVRGSDKRWTV